MLTAEDHARIEQAVAAAEKTTSGEICCIVAEEVSNYPEIPFIGAALVAFGAPLILIVLGVFPDQFIHLLERWQAAHVAATEASAKEWLIGLVIVQALVFVGAATFISYSPLKHALAIPFVRHLRVWQHAHRQFRMRRLDRTRERNGVLIFASLSDRVAVVIADKGINDKVEPGAWTRAIDVLVAAMVQGKARQGLVDAIGICGSLLAKHFPATDDNRNELPDVLIDPLAP